MRQVFTCMIMLLCLIKWYREVIDYRGEEREGKREQEGKRGKREKDKDRKKNTFLPFFPYCCCRR